MDAKLIEGGKFLQITIPVSPQPSKSGNSMVIASSKGNKPTTVEYNGKAIVIGVNAYVSR